MEIDLTGTWKYKVGKDLSEVEQYAEQLKNLKTAGLGLYKGMMHPIREYKVSGTIWYQGEANSDRPSEYAPLLQALITNWRERWDMPEMPFLLVQLLNFMPQSKQLLESGWAGVCEAQLQIAKEGAHRPGRKL